MQTISRVLDNGLKTHVYPFPQLETVSIAFGVKTGSIDEKPQTNGSSHFLEHMLFKGTKKRTWKQINDELKELGVHYNAFTDHETTVYFMQAHKSYIEKTAEIMSDMIKNSTIPANEFELERGPIINENLIRHDNPHYMISDYMPMAIYKNHPAKMPVGGDNEKTIRKMKRGSLLEIYKKYYTPRNSVLSIYGGLPKEKAYGIASKYFGNLQKEYVKPNRKVAREKPNKRNLTIARKGIMQTRLGIGFMCKEFNPKDIDEFVSLLVMEKYLDDKLFEEIREKRGLSYDPMASYNPYSTFGFIAAAAGIQPKNLNEAKEIMLKEFEKLQNGEINKNEFSNTKKGLQIEERIKRERTGEMSINMAMFELLYGGVKLLDALPERIGEVTLDDARKYCQKYINVDKYGMVLLKPS